jgi:hypothetical protein
MKPRNSTATSIVHGLVWATSYVACIASGDSHFRAHMEVGSGPAASDEQLSQQNSSVDSMPSHLFLLTCNHNLQLWPVGELHLTRPPPPREGRQVNIFF